MEIHAISEALQWIGRCLNFKHVLVATDSMFALQKVRSGFLHSDWVAAIGNGCIDRVTWVFCPGHAGVRGNERVDELAGSAAIGQEITLDPPAIMLLVKERTENSESSSSSYTTGVLIDKGIERGAGRQSSLRGPARRLFNQLLFETISRKTLLWSLQRRDEQVWLCADCNDSHS